VNNSKKLLVLHEGVVPYAYQDSLGYWTIGVGHLIDRRKGGRLSEFIIWQLLDSDYAEVEADLDRVLPWARDLDPVRRHVLIDMGFNLGITGLLGFQNTLAAVKDRRWEDASKGMLASRWASQVGRRSVRLAEMMRTGTWPAVLNSPAAPDPTMIPSGK